MRSTYGLIGVPTFGTVSIEWSFAKAHLGAGLAVYVVDYFVKDKRVDEAKNMIAEEAIRQNCDWCFTGITAIETKGGQKSIRDIKEGDLVKTHKGRYQKVLRVIRRPYPEKRPLISLKTPHTEIKCTPEHPFYSYAGGNFNWVRAVDLKQTDFLLYPYSPHADFININ